MLSLLVSSRGRYVIRGCGNVSLEGSRTVERTWKPGRGWVGQRCEMLGMELRKRTLVGELEGEEVADASRGAAAFWRQLELVIDNHCQQRGGPLC